LDLLPFSASNISQTATVPAAVPFVQGNTSIRVLEGVSSIHNNSNHFINLPQILHKSPKRI